MTIPELLLVFTASGLASVHCGAMCGGFTLSLVRPARPSLTLPRLAVYHAGKIFTYVFIGGMAGMAGAALLSHPALRAAQAAVSALAGAAIVLLGLQAVGLLPGHGPIGRIASRLWLGPFLGSILQIFRQRDTLDGPFFLGVFNGFLPCGLVYSFALAAAATGSPPAALATMLAFGLGTVPILLAIGLSGTALSGSKRLRPAMARASGVLMIALGAVTAVRGAPLVATWAASGLHGHDGGARSPAGLTTAAELEPWPAPNFALTDQDGRSVRLEDYRGRVVVLDFIHTTCTVACPRLTSTYLAVQRGLGPHFAQRVALVSITVDPEADTPAVLKAFGQRAGADLTGWAFLTGSPDQIRSVTEDYGVYVQHVAHGLAHTDTILLIDKRGRLRAVYGMEADPDAIVERARRLAGEP